MTFCDFIYRFIFGRSSPELPQTAQEVVTISDNIQSLTLPDNKIKNTKFLINDSKKLNVQENEIKDILNISEALNVEEN